MGPYLSANYVSDCPPNMAQVSVLSDNLHMPGLAEIYQDYIDGKKELREINMEFNARYIKGEDMPGRYGCQYK